ncbi:MAG TPA: hypothetical protein VJ824_07440 [Bacillota bacterium]|nr:hypothetical protein [Bacillota bacterium]
MSSLDDLFICTNPSRRDVKNIYQDEKYARGIILANGDMIVWNGEIMHGKVMPYLNETGLHFSVFNDKLEICWQYESWGEIQNRLKLAQKYLDILGLPENGRIVFDTMFYTHTKLEFPTIKYSDLFEEGYEIKPIE